MLQDMLYLNQKYGQCDNVAAKGGAIDAEAATSVPL